MRGNDAKGRSAVRPLSVEVVEFSPALVPENSLLSGRKTMSSGASGVIPAVVANPPVPTAAGVTFSAVAEVHVSASASDEDSLVAQISEQHIVCNTDPGKIPTISSVPTGDTLVNKPMMHSAQKIYLDGIPMEEVVVLEPLAFSVPDLCLDSRPMAGNTDWNPSEHAVPEEDQTSRPMEGVTCPAPLGHSVMKLHLDSQPSRNKLKPDQSGCPVPDDPPRRKVGFYDNQTVSDLFVDSNMYGGGDPVPRRAPSELAEHSTSVEHSLRLLQPKPSEQPAGTPRGVVGFSDNQPVTEPTEQSETCVNWVPKPAPSALAEQPRSDRPPLWGEGLSSGTDTVSRPLPVALPGVAPESRQSEDPPRMDQQETTETRPECGEAIIVGAIGSAAPWFLTGWAHEVEIEFMIDTGCQVTILSMTVFEHMCTVYPAVRSALRPCLRRLVSADSSPLIVQGQLELAIVFPGLCCDMFLWWPTLVLTVYWAQRPYSPTYHTNWICGQVSCGQMDGLHCSYNNSD